MTVTFPDVGKNRRWSVRKRQIPDYCFSRYTIADIAERPYSVWLEEVKSTNMFGHKTWQGAELVIVRDLETDTLLEAAKVILERVAKSDWEKSRLGTYPPKTLED